MNTSPIITPFYAGNIQYYSKLAHYPSLIADVFQHYEKQTFRNRCRIMTAGGIMDLIIPVVKPNGNKTIDKDIKILNDGWQKIHWRALEAAYRNSPFFMYYEDDIRPFYQKDFTFLADFNLTLTECLCGLIGIYPNIQQSTQYVERGSSIDLRQAMPCKKDSMDPHFRVSPYYQVFADKSGFIPNLSILDLLFNMGNEAILVLQKSYLP